MKTSRALLLILILAVTGCSHIPSSAPPPATGIDGEACVGSVATPPAGLQPITNAALMGLARFASGKGGVCAGSVYSVQAPVVLYRVFDSTNPRSKFGGWWALTPPAGPRDKYRADYAICPEWSKLDRWVSCEVRPGTEVVIGTTQSATCGATLTYPKTAENQVYVANNGQAGIVLVGACSEDKAWPE